MFGYCKVASVYKQCAQWDCYCSIKQKIVVWHLKYHVCFSIISLSKNFLLFVGVTKVSKLIAQFKTTENNVYLEYSNEGQLLFKNIPFTCSVFTDVRINIEGSAWSHLYTDLCVYWTSLLYCILTIMSRVFGLVKNIDNT